jgi:enterochelin esterase-like enzyme
MRIGRNLVGLVTLTAALSAGAQPPAMPRRTPTPNDSLVSPEVAADGRVTFRLYAPKATEVAVTGEVTPGFGQPLALARDERGVWSAVSAPLAPGAYRYTFVVDGVSVLDPKNLATSASQTALASLAVVSPAGDDFQADRADVPHGAVATVRYRSATLGERRMHVYTPPGYRRAHAYPVLYLIHGGGDADESWSTVGRAGFILDNLIAAGKARPMVVVMPAGGVGTGTGARSAPMTSDAAQDPFTRDLLESIVPYVEANYDVSTRPEDRALAGLSMGGIQTLNIGLTHLDTFRWLGVFSSGWFPADLQAFEARRGKALETTKTPPKLFWMAHGATDIAKPQSEKVIAMLRAHGLTVVSKETPGGHTWENWRDYLRDFAPLLFREARR